MESRANISDEIRPSNHIGHLKVIVERAENLPKGIFGGAATIDPYLKLRIDNNDRAQKGLVKEKAGKDPVFNEYFEFDLNGNERGINIEIWDETVLKNTELASVYVRLDDLIQRAQGSSQWFDLQSKSDKLDSRVLVRCEFQGQGGSGIQSQSMGTGMSTGLPSNKEVLSGEKGIPLVAHTRIPLKDRESSSSSGSSEDEKHSENVRKHGILDVQATVILPEEEKPKEQEKIVERVVEQPRLVPTNVVLTTTQTASMLMPESSIPSMNSQQPSMMVGSGMQQQPFQSEQRSLQSEQRPMQFQQQQPIEQRGFDTPSEPSLRYTSQGYDATLGGEDKSKKSLLGKIFGSSDKDKDRDITDTDRDRSGILGSSSGSDNRSGIFGSSSSDVTSGHVKGEHTPSEPLAYLAGSHTKPYDVNPESSTSKNYMSSGSMISSPMDVTGNTGNLNAGQPYSSASTMSSTLPSSQQHLQGEKPKHHNF